MIKILWLNLMINQKLLINQIDGKIKYHVIDAPVEKKDG